MAQLYKYNLPSGQNKEDVKLKDLWSGFKEDTTAHGIPHVDNAEGKCKKGFFLCISISACGFLLLHMYTAFTTFFAYNSTVKVSILQSYQTVFPTVTVCNINPIKRSTLHLDVVLNELLGDDNEVQSRRKRYLDMTCTAEQIYTATGMCYGVLSASQDYDKNEAESYCAGISAILYMPVSSDIEQFVISSGILDSISFNHYWLGLEANGWLDRVPPSYTNYAGSNSLHDDLVVAVNLNHKWRIRDDDAAIVCQKLIGCPFLTYTSPSNEEICWFMPFGDSESAWNDAELACPLVHTDAHLIELDTREKSDFLINESGLFNTQMSGLTYWLGLKMDSGDWQWSGQDSEFTWTNWDTANSEPHSSFKGTAADIDNNHLWRTTLDNDDAHTAMVICEIYGMQSLVQPITSIPSTQSGTTETTYLNTVDDKTTLMDATTDLQSTTLAISTDPTTDYVTTELMQPSTLGYHTTHNIPDSFSTILTTIEEIASTHEATTQSLAETTLYQEDTTTPIASSIEGRLPLREEFIVAETVVENLAILSPETKILMGYDSTEFIIDCTFEGSLCSQSDFYLLNDPIFGNCYMFNSGWNDSSVKLAKKTGRRYGLSLVLNIGESEYISTLGGAAGARVVIHDQHRMPHPDDEGYLARPGDLTSIGMQKVELERLPEPHGNCTENVRSLGKDLFAEKFDMVHYSRANCFRTCYQKAVVERCKCGDPYYPLTGKALRFARNIQPCSTMNQTQDDCRYVTNKDYVDGNLPCLQKCPDPCKEKFYRTTMSSASWPSAQHLEDLKTKYEDKIPEVVNSMDVEAFQRNLLTIEVFFDDFNVEQITEVESYRKEQFASDVGGILGLWLGLSVISMFEFLELGMDILVFGYLCICRKLSKWLKSKTSKKDLTKEKMVCKEKGNDVRRSSLETQLDQYIFRSRRNTKRHQSNVIHPEHSFTSIKSSNKAKQDTEDASKSATQSPSDISIYDMDNDVFAYMDHGTAPEWWYNEKRNIINKKTKDKKTITDC